MSFDRIPNELLMQIFESLSFQDAIQCALVCKRFYNLIRNNFSKYYIDIWNPETAPPGEANFRNLPASTNSFVATSKKSTDLYEFHPFSRGLYRTARSELILYGTLFDLIPDTAQVAFRKGPGENILVIYDLKKDLTICEVKFDIRIADIKCGKNVIALIDYSDNLVMLFSWDGIELGFLTKITDANCPVLSKNGILAFNSRTRASRVYYVDCNEIEPTDIGIALAETAPFGRIVIFKDGRVQGFPCSETHSALLIVNRICKRKRRHRHQISQEIPLMSFTDDEVTIHSISPCGDFLVVQSRHTHKIIERRKKEVIFEFEPPSVLWLSRIFFSSDSRFVLHHWNNKVLIIDLQVKLRFFSPRLDLEENKLRVDFRDIDGEQYVQVMKQTTNYEVQFDLHNFDEIRSDGFASSKRAYYRCLGDKKND